jgi:hypothetical protein
MPLGAARLNSLSRRSVSEPAFPIFEPGVYFYTQEVPNRDVFAGYDRQIAVLGGSSSSNTIYLGATYLKDTLNEVYTYPLYFDEAESSFTFGNDVFLGPSNGNSIRGQRIVSEQDDQPTVSDIDTFGLVYTARSNNPAFSVIRMDANGNYTVGDQQENITFYNIGTADNPQDMPFLGIIDGKPTYVNGGRSIQQTIYTRNGFDLTEEIIFSGTQTTSNRSSSRPFNTGGIGLKGWTMYDGQQGNVGATLLLDTNYNIQATTLQGSSLGQGRTVELSDGSTSKLVISGGNNGLSLRIGEIQWSASQAPSISYGSISTVISTHTQRTYDVVKSFNQNEFFLIYQDESESNRLRLRTLSVSGTTISLISDIALNDFNSNILDVDATLCQINNRNYIVGSVVTVNKKKQVFCIRFV